jgi:hypothetical protein
MLPEFKKYKGRQDRKKEIKEGIITITCRDNIKAAIRDISCM